MRTRFSDNDLANVRADLAVCFAYEGDAAPRNVTDVGLRRQLSAQMSADAFGARVGDILLWNADGEFPARRFAIVGLGPAGAPGAESIETVRAGSARASREAARIGARALAVRPPECRKGEDPLALARASVEGVLLGAYRFDRHLTDPVRRQTSLKSIELTADGDAAMRRKALRLGQRLAEATCLARDLVNEPPSIMTPTRLAAIAAEESKSAGLQCKILGPLELRRLGMRSILAVARGSAEAPRVVHLTFKPRRKSKQRVVLVGKGVTFDSGGLDLKPAPSMLHMKSDMAGAAAVLGAMTALGNLGCSVEVHGLLGLTENMTGAAAFKPGDILETYSGKTVEIGNTDAEGRLVLCDLLAYAAKKLRPSMVVDLATLTGACVVALGTSATGLFTRHAALGDALLAAGAVAGERLWAMPMYDDYLQQMQKGPADLNNIGSRWGGAITAALFLGEFVPPELPWAHLDIAGPAFNENEHPTVPLGGTGAGVPTLLRWLESL